MPEVISSRSNPLVKQIRSLRQKKGRDETGLFLVEGIHHVGEAIEAGWEVETLVYAPDQLTSEYAIQMVEARSRYGLRCIPFTPDLFADVAEKENPQGILAVVRQRRLGLDAVAVSKIHLAAALVSPQDPGNVGTILRTIDAVEAQALFLLDGGVDLYHPSVIRASMGTLFWIPVVEAGFGDFSAWLQEHPFRLIGTSAHAAVDYLSVEPDETPTILLFGSEQKGLSAEQLERCDLRVSMPMKGRASSLNLAVAAGVLLYRFMQEK